MTKKNEITDLTLGGYVNGDDMLFVRRCPEQMYMVMSM